MIIVVHSDGMADHDQCLLFHAAALLLVNTINTIGIHATNTADLDNEEHKVVIKKMVGTPNKLQFASAKL